MLAQPSSTGTGTDPAAAPAPDTDTDQLMSPEPQPAERVSEAGLRPRTLPEFVGQTELKGHLDVLLGAARRRRESADHLLFAGPRASARPPWPT